jgi:beta-glucosidase
MFPSACLREVFLLPFRRRIQKAGAISVMASYNEIDGVPSHAKRMAAARCVAQGMGLQGLCGFRLLRHLGIGYRPDTHGHWRGRDKKEAARWPCGGRQHRIARTGLLSASGRTGAQGVLKESQLDELVAPMLFGNSNGVVRRSVRGSRPWRRRLSVARPTASWRCRRRAKPSPCSKTKQSGAAEPGAKSKSIAVIGPNADRELLGGYSGGPSLYVRARRHPRQSRRPRASPYAKAAKSPSAARGTRTWSRPAIPPRTASKSAEAVEVAKQADVIVLAIGGNEQTSREAWSLKHMGDRANLDLIGRQEELVNAIVATGKPVIVFLFNGRPLSINYLGQGAGDFRMLVSRPGNRPRGGGCFVRRPQSRRQAAHHHSAFGRPSAGVLQPQTLGAARLFV